MNKKKPYVHSNYERRKDDDYKTIDSRCTQALVELIPLWGDIVDCCSPSGSGIVDFLKDWGFSAKGTGDAFIADTFANWIVTNPPFKRGLVDRIMWAQIRRVERQDVDGFAALLRINFDFAKSRYEMFTHPMYAGQIHMMFRPWWSEEKKHQPIHNYVWHVWRWTDIPAHPEVYYWRES